MGQGKNNAVAFLKEETKIRYELENRIREKHEIPLIELEDLQEEKREDERKGRSCQRIGCYRRNGL